MYRVYGLKNPDTGKVNVQTLKEVKTIYFLIDELYSFLQPRLTLGREITIEYIVRKGSFFDDGHYCISISLFVFGQRVPYFERVIFRYMNTSRTIHVRNNDVRNILKYNVPKGLRISNKKQ